MPKKKTTPKTHKDSYCCHLCNSTEYDEKEICKVTKLKGLVEYKYTTYAECKRCQFRTFLREETIVEKKIPEKIPIKPSIIPKVAYNTSAFLSPLWSGKQRF